MLELHSINRSFGDRRVLRDVSFTVAGGRMTGFVGGNGAGKTTTMRVILGVLAADSGTVTLDGAPLTAEQRTRFGYMPEERGLYPKMKIAEQIVYLGRLHGMSQTQAKQNTESLLERLGLGERVDDTVESLSLGNQQRAQIAAALVHDPEVLVLDEPFSGLDPIAVEVVLNVLKDFAATGAPVIFSSHQLDIVERLCDDLVVIADGEIRASGSREGIRAAHTLPRYEIQLGGDAGWLRDEAGVTVLDFDGGYSLFDVDTDETAQRVLQRAIATSTVERFAPQLPSLSQIFKEVIQ
ncbi:ABC-2 type transport system ATP-binding protein [Conyzicola lurida]|uniref:ABC-2 type transport system ATP-binding protein n=1 Tax=Conyzicola lurida TaxID=1172621 RepID=A0A841ATX0_9MICO|nr:ATP-binding cassette domain-containing protein [Conyzicola lurida]MBB5845035.1 ABC-2 type transport system ATP-binding protein [Conyzicola lurida]